MGSVRRTDEVYEEGHMGRALGGVSCLSISLPVCSPQFIPVIALRTLHSSHPSLTPPTAVWPQHPSAQTLTHVFSGGAQTKRHPRD